MCGERRVRKISVSPSQICCKPKIALKKVLSYKHEKGSDTNLYLGNSWGKGKTANSSQFLCLVILSSFPFEQVWIKPCPTNSHVPKRPTFLKEEIWWGHSLSLEELLFPSPNSPPSSSGSPPSNQPFTKSDLSTRVVPGIGPTAFECGQNTKDTCSDRT